MHGQQDIKNIHIQICMQCYVPLERISLNIYQNKNRKIVGEEVKLVFYVQYSFPMSFATFEILKDLLPIYIYIYIYMEFHIKSFRKS